VSLDPLLLVLDLDETLLYSTEAPLDRPAELEVGPFHTYFRPGVHDFIAAAREQFTLAVWTASTRSYATPIVQRLLGDPEELAFFYASERCARRYDPDSMGTYPLKKLVRVRKLGFSMARTLIVDNTPSTYSKNYGNGVPIPDFTGDLSDRLLERLLPFLMTLAAEPDVRPPEKRGWWR
jgi:TFIIF-interacting CTD phosphatase-like protein